MPRNDNELKVRVIQDAHQPTDETFPQVKEALLLKLEKIFPDTSPPITTPDREIWWKAGQASGVSYLRVEYERQQNKG